MKSLILIFMSETNLADDVLLVVRLILQRLGDGRRSLPQLDHIWSSVGGASILESSCLGRNHLLPRRVRVTVLTRIESTYSVAEKQQWKLPPHFSSSAQRSEATCICLLGATRKVQTLQTHGPESQGSNGARKHAPRTETSDKARGMK